MSTTTQQSVPPGSKPGVQRGCGYREEGGVYLEVGISDEGEPFESFWADPPVPWDTDTKIGQQLIERDGITHIVDHVGSASYPYPSDVLEEMRSFGLSRRVSKTFDFDRLTPQTRIILVHDRAVADTPAAVVEHVKEAVPRETPNDTARRLRFTQHRDRCARWIAGDETHIATPKAAPCTRMWYADAESNKEGSALRAIGDCRYQLSTDADLDASFSPGIIASFPLHRLSVIQSADGSHTETRERVMEECAHHPVVLRDA